MYNPDHMALVSAYRRKMTNRESLHHPYGENPNNPLSELTNAEVSCLELLTHGCSNREIAEIRFTREQTAKYHFSNIFKKLGVRTRVEAAILYIIWS